MIDQFVSTHSRPKAAGLLDDNAEPTACFNTQPPEGGWTYAYPISRFRSLFQHTAARRRLSVHW